MASSVVDDDRTQRRILASILRRMRSDAGLKQSELASRVGLTQPVISKIEMGERQVDLVDLRSLCAACGRKLPELTIQFEQELIEHQSSQRE